MRKLQPSLAFTQLHGNTNGWIGMGISPNGAMTGADIAVGWVKDGTPLVTVRNSLQFKIIFHVQCDFIFS